MSSYPVCIVRWADSVEHHDGSGSPKHVPVIQVRVGWLLQHDEEGISVASELSESDSDWRGEHFIPSAMILSVEVLEDVS